jgi:hypothetical protein
MFLRTHWDSTRPTQKLELKSELKRANRGTNNAAENSRLGSSTHRKRELTA